MSQASQGETIIRFDKVSFNYGYNKPILDGVSFSVRRGMKVTIVGQNGAGKSTIFSLITGEKKQEEGTINLAQRATIALSRQVIPREELDLTVREFFEKCLKNVSDKKIYDIDPKIDDVLEVVNLKGHEKVHDRIVRTFSGGQQARLLLASALIQEPDILLLDEPTNNLDKAGIAHLTDFLVQYKKTVIVISHDSNFLNAFSNGVLYLDIYTRKVEQYMGNYNNVLKDITARVEKENMKNAQLQKEIQAKKDQANEFAYKGGRLRLVAKRMREKAEELEEEIVDVRKEDKTIRPFTIPCQPDLQGEIVNISSLSVMDPKKHKIVTRKANISLKKKMHLLLSGPNGIGKSTLLESLAKGTAKGAKIREGIRVGYYRQDFSTLNFEDTVRDSLAKVLKEVTGKIDEEYMRSVAASFLITQDVINTKIGDLSEGQKGLVAFARLVLERPGLLILDEPTNHINFRHLPVIARALDQYEGAMILVSHVPDFVEQIRIDEKLDLES
ncbi:ABC-F family ATP-binding cassette domain-containing protein [Candidatus Nomurabacteria bacterium]|nr:ABC-F family ATP-binding cassette domain-containing protein [Candidatus Nomurabacteria bacterium]